MKKTKNPVHTFTAHLEDLVSWAFHSDVSTMTIMAELLDAAAMIAAQIGVKPSEMEKMMRTSTVKAFVIYGNEAGQA